MISCMRSKTECKNCKHNIDGYCKLVKKNVDDIIKQWRSAKRSKARRKYKENAHFFEEKVIDNIIRQANIIQNSGLRSKEQIDAMNEMNAIFYNWKTINTEDLFWFGEIK